jgi:hypothetical protein
MTNKNYFGQEQEDCVEEYLKTESQEIKNIIYEECLKYPLEKMVESIINRYRLYSETICYKDLFDDTLSFLHTKIDLFDPTKGFKAYSYFGTIIVRKLKDNRKKEHKNKKNIVKTDNVYQVAYGSSDIEDVPYKEEELIFNFFSYIRDDIKILVESNPESVKIKEHHKKVGFAIIQIIDIFRKEDMGDGLRFKKNFVIQCIKDMTKLTHNQIISALKFFKKYYDLKKNNFLKELNKNI